MQITKTIDIIISSDDIIAALLKMGVIMPGQKINKMSLLNGNAGVSISFLEVETKEGVNLNPIVFTTEQETFLSSLIVDADLSVRAFNCCKACKFQTLRDIVEFSQEDLMKIKNFGQKSIEEIVKLFASHGIKIKEK